jgi:hypothetical protein
MFSARKHPIGSHQSINRLSCPLCPGLFFSLMRLTWFVLVVEDRQLGGLGEGKNGA